VPAFVWLTVVAVLCIASVVAVARLRVRRRRRIEAAEGDVVSVASRLAGHAPLSTVNDAVGGSVRGDLDATIMAMLRAEPNVYTKTALAKQVGSGYATVLKRIAALQDDGLVVPNARGAKLALAPERPAGSS
jgi:hypothetical protein